MLMRTGSINAESFRAVALRIDGYLGMLLTGSADIVESLDWESLGSHSGIRNRGFPIFP